MSRKRRFEEGAIGKNPLLVLQSEMLQGEETDNFEIKIGRLDARSHMWTRKRRNKKDNEGDEQPTAPPLPSDRQLLPLLARP